MIAATISEAEKSKEFRSEEKSMMHCGSGLHSSTVRGNPCRLKWMRSRFHRNPLEATGVDNDVSLGNKYIWATD